MRIILKKKHRFHLHYASWNPTQRQIHRFIIIWRTLYNLCPDISNSDMNKLKNTENRKCNKFANQQIFFLATALSSFDAAIWPLAKGIVYLEEDPDHVVAEGEVDEGGEDKNNEESAGLGVPLLLLVVPVALAGEEPAHPAAQPLPQLGELSVPQLQTQVVHAQVDHPLALVAQLPHIVLIAARRYSPAAVGACWCVVREFWNCFWFGVSWPAASWVVTASAGGVVASSRLAASAGAREEGLGPLQQGHELPRRGSCNLKCKLSILSMILYIVWCI